MKSVPTHAIAKKDYFAGPYKVKVWSKGEKRLIVTEDKDSVMVKGEGGFGVFGWIDKNELDFVEPSKNCPAWPSCNCIVKGNKEKDCIHNHC